MILFVFGSLTFLASVKGLCYSPVLHGFAPDVILSSALSSEIHCPAPLAFDHFLCMCVEPTVMRVRDERTSLNLNLLGAQQKLALRTPFHVSRLVGLPDMHVPRRSQTWQPINPVYNFQGSSMTHGDRVVPVLNPYGTLNIPANGKKIAKAKLMGSPTVDSKQKELLEKARWQEELQKNAAAIVAVELAATSVPASSGVNERAGSSLDLLMRNTLRRILSGN